MHTLAKKSNLIPDLDNFFISVEPKAEQVNKIRPIEKEKQVKVKIENKENEIGNGFKVEPKKENEIGNKENEIVNNENEIMNGFDKLKQEVENQKNEIRNGFEVEPKKENGNGFEVEPKNENKENGTKNGI